MNRTTIEELINQNYSIRMISDQTGKSYTSIRYWLNKYGLKTSPLKRGGRRLVSERKCQTCNETDEANFYNRRKNMCKVCHNKYTIEIWRNNRLKIVNHLGGKCVHCGFNAYISSLDVHHTDPIKKDPKFGGHKGWHWNRILKELETCVLLCRNCHSAYHNGELVGVSGIEPLTS